MQATSFLKKILFWLTATVVICGAFFWGVRIILQISTNYSAAVSATRDIGIYVQRIGSYTSRLTMAQNPTVYRANQQMVQSIVDKLERKHLSLIQGNPKLSGQSIFSDDLKSIYYAMPTNLVNQARDFLFHAKKLSEIPFGEFVPDNKHVVFIRIAAQSGLIQSVGHVIQSFKTENEAKASRAIFIMVAILITSVVMLTILYAYTFEEPKAVQIPEEMLDSPEHVSTVFGGLSLLSGKQKRMVNLAEDKNFHSENLV